MMTPVLIFERYPLQPGQRIHIKDGPRKGDWEVLEVTEKKVRLRCPVTGFQANWDRFCYLVEEKKTAWPAAEEK